MTTKPTNPKDAVGSSKLPFHHIPSPVLGEIGLALLEGGLKYGSHNWRAIGVRASVYHDATMRHLLAFWEGEDIDPDSGLSHVTKAIASLVVLRDAMIQGQFNDDRPIKAKSGWVQEGNQKAAELVQKCPNPKSPFLAIDEPAPATPPPPDAGEGYRLLSWDELVEPGDECSLIGLLKPIWQLSGMAGRYQSPAFYYRRKVAPEPPPVEDAPMPCNSCTVDPGEGYRLLDANEVLQEGDEFCQPIGGGGWEWRKSSKAGCSQPRNSTYRRKISAVHPGPFHRIVRPDEPIREGDEVWLPATQTWETSGAWRLGSQRLPGMTYRRPINPPLPKS